MPQDIFKELVEGRERPAITLEPVAEVADPTLEYVIDDDDYYYFDEYNMVDEDDRLAEINYQVTIMVIWQPTHQAAVKIVMMATHHANND